MKYTIDSPHLDWSKFEYYPHLSASEDLKEGGWILHNMAPGDSDNFSDYLRCQSLDCRFSRIAPLCQRPYYNLPAYESKYQNWYHLHFPLIALQVNVEYDGQMEYDDLPNEIRRACNMAEGHLLIDQIFERFVYDKTRRFKNEWDTFTDIEKNKLLTQFIESKRGDEQYLRQPMPQAEFDPYFLEQGSSS